jgi:hypothetical protein
MGQAQFGLTLGGIGKPEIREHVSGATNDRFSPNQKHIVLKALDRRHRREQVVRI